jgi:hypothetical protein
MKRYQVYLEQDDVETLDQVERITQVSRSSIIRDAVSAASSNLKNVLVVSRYNNAFKSPSFLKHAGILTEQNKSPKSISKEEDAIYSKTTND